MTEKRSKKMIKQLIIFLSIIFLLSFFSAFYFDDGGIIHAIQYTCFQIFCMLVPGGVIILLLNPKKITQIELVIYSYVLGYGISLVVYFLTVPFGWKGIIQYIYILFAILSIFFFIFMSKKRKINIIDDKFGMKICCISGIIMLFVQIIMSCGLHTLPIKQATSTYQDYLFGVGNTIAASKEYPIVDFRVIDRTLSYHYINNIHLAVIKIIFDIPAFHLTAFYSYIQTIILLVGGSYLFFHSILGKTTKGILLGIFLLLYTTGYESAHRMTYLAHMYVTPNNLDIALAFGMILVSVVYSQTKKSKVDILYLTVALISFIVAFGSKAPLGMIATAVCAFLGILYILKQRKIGIVLPYALLIVVFGLVVYVSLLHVSAERSVVISQSASSGSVYFWGIMPEVREWLFQIFGNISPLLSEILLGIYFCVVSFYPIFILFFIGIILFFVYYKEIEIIDISFFLATILGMCITLIYAHSGGGSQYYFLLGTFPFVIAFGLRGICLLLNKRHERFIYSMICSLCSLCLIIGIINSYFVTDETVNRNEFERGISYIAGHQVVLEDHHSWSANLVYPDEYKAYVWLRENTEEDDILISDMCIAGYTRYTYSEGVFSERYIYIPQGEALNVIRDCYRGEVRAIREVMEKNNVKYMIQTARITSDLDFPSSLGEIVFENKAMKIYKLYE